MRNEWTAFLNALMFYSRIPVPRNTPFSNEILNRATRYFPLVGAIIGGLGALCFWSAHLILPTDIAIILSMAFTIFITGAFHEDGFADFCDGFGGGHTREKILEIMKDSRIGTYGAAGLILMLLTKFLCLGNIRESSLPIVIIAAHTFSRFAPVVLIYTSQYVRIDLTSKVKPIGHRDSPLAFLVALCTGGLSLLLLDVKTVFLIISLTAITFLLFRKYVNKRLAGYTGDVLGALQQISELVIYVAIVISQNNW